MGNRAVIVLTDNGKYEGYGLYLHWNGGAESVYAFLDYAQEVGAFGHSVSYATARLAQIIGNFMGDTLSLGIERLKADWHLVERYNGLDNGLYRVDMSSGNYRVTHRVRNGKLLSDDDIADEENRARQHAYWQGDTTIMQQIRLRNNLFFASSHEQKVVAAMQGAAKELWQALTDLLAFSRDYGVSDRVRYEDWSGYFEAAEEALKKASYSQSP